MGERPYAERLGGVLALYDEMHGAVDAAARVPAAVGHEGVVDGDFKFILPLFHKGGDVDAKFRIAVLVRARLLAVYEHFGVAVDPLKEKGNALARLLGGKGKALCIAVLAAREVGAVSPARASARALFLEHGVVGKVDGSPRAPLFLKIPILIEIVVHKCLSLIRKILF